MHTVQKIYVYFLDRTHLTPQQTHSIYQGSLNDKYLKAMHDQ